MLIQLPARRCRTERQKEELTWERAAHQTRKQIKDQIRNQPPCGAFTAMRKIKNHDFPKKPPKGSTLTQKDEGREVYRFEDGSTIEFERFKGRVFINAFRNAE